MKILGNIIPFFISQLDNYTSREIKSLAYISIEKILGFNKSDCIIKNDYRLNKKEIQFFIDVVSDLKKNIPIQYVLKEAYFYNLRFRVDNSTLIPRNETEELVRWVLESNFDSLLDIGTGSGCISISIAKNSLADIYALDSSKRALEVAKFNANYHNVKVNFICEDIFQYISNKKYDVIVSNPPYVLESEKAYMAKNVIDYEPHSALFVSDEDPLKFYTKIVSFSSNFLKKNGLLFLEINEKNGKKIKSLLSKNNFVDIELKKDINGRDRMIKSVLK